MDKYCWESITKCVNCFRVRRYDNQHPSSPCPECGSRVEEGVGKFVSEKKWYDFWKIFTDYGYWIVKD